MVAIEPPGALVEGLLRRLARGSFAERSDLTGGSNLAGGSASAFGRFVELESEFLKASTRRRYAELGEALAAELAAEGRRRRLGIYHPERVWFLSRGTDGWLWAGSLTPRLPMLREDFNRPGGPQGRTWSLYLEALELSLSLAEREGVFLDWNPSNFALEGGRLFYVDDDLLGGRAPALAVQALLRLREYAESDLAGRLAFVEGLAATLQRRSREQLRAWGWARDLRADVLWPREEALSTSLRRLLAWLEGTREKTR